MNDSSSDVTFLVAHPKGVAINPKKVYTPPQVNSKNFNVLKSSKWVRLFSGDTPNSF